MGVAVDTRRLDVRQSLTPGGGYRLPAIGVRNPGDTTSTYELGIAAIDGEAAPPAAWFRFAPKRLTLKPGQTRRVGIRISVPSNAQPGDYDALLQAQLVTDGPGARIGAAAAARLSFTVESATLLQAWWLRLRTMLSDATPWPFVAAALIVAGVATRQLHLRFAVSIRRRASG